MCINFDLCQKWQNFPRFLRNTTGKGQRNRYWIFSFREGVAQAILHCLLSACQVQFWGWNHLELGLCIQLPRSDCSPVTSGRLRSMWSTHTPLGCADWLMDDKAGWKLILVYIMSIKLMITSKVVPVYIQQDLGSNFHSAWGFSLVKSILFCYLEVESQRQVTVTAQ